MHLIRTDFPAPLSPASAVTCPAGMSRSTSVRARTGPKFLLMPRSRSSGSPASSDEAVADLPSALGLTWSVVSSCS